MPKQDVSVFIELLKDVNSEIKIEAIQALGELGGEQAVIALTNCLFDTHWRVREQAALTLAKCGEVGVKALLQQALEDKTEESYEAAILGLQNVKDVTALKPLISLFHSSGEEILYKLAIILSQLHEKGLDILTSLLSNNTTDKIRDYALLGMRELKDARAIPSLVEIVTNEQSSTLRRHAIVVIGNIGNAEASNILISALQDRDASVRAKATYFLGIIGDETSIESLKAALADGDKSVREETTFSLQNLLGGNV